MLRKLTEAQTEQIVSLAKSGVMLSRIAKQFRLSASVARHSKKVLASHASVAETRCVMEAFC
jgi:hypothetical protein